MIKCRHLICFVLVLGLVFGSALPSFAATSVDQETLYPLLRAGRSGSIYWHDGTRNTFSSSTAIGYLLATFSDAASDSLRYIYNSVDGVESSLSTISGKIMDYSTVLSNISGYVDGLETALSTSNTRLQSILTAIQGITTYNYTSVLNSILANSNSIPTIESDIRVTNSILGSSNTGIYGSVIGVNSNILNLLDRIGSLSGITSKIPMRYNIGSTHDGIRTISGLTYPTFNTTSGNSQAAYQYNTVTSTDDNLSDLLAVNNIIGNFIASKLFTPYQLVNRKVLDSNFNLINYQINGVNVGYLSISEMVEDLLAFTASPLAKLQYALADDDSVQRKKDNAALTSGALDQVTGSGDAAASLSDFTSVSSGLGDIKTSVSGGASASSAFAVLNGGSNAWDWFSEDCQYDMDTTSGDSSSGSRSLKSVSSGASSSTPLLDQYYSSVLSFLGGFDD